MLFFDCFKLEKDSPKTNHFSRLFFHSILELFSREDRSHYLPNTCGVRIKKDRL